MPSKKKTPTKKKNSQKRKSSSDQTSGSKRKHPILITKPIILGNYAIGLKKKDTERLWCKWVCYVRGLVLDDDLNYISKVVFHLHETFNPPVVTITKPPFETEQEGWGQFPLFIDIHFHSSSGLDPIRLQYDLKLPSDNAIKKRKPFVSEQYEELLFYDPNEQFEQILKTNTENVKNTIKKIKTATEASLKHESDSDDDNITSERKSGATTTSVVETSSFRPSVSAQIEQHAPILKEEASLKAITEMAEKLKEQIREREQPSMGSGSKSESSSRSKSKKSKSNKKLSKKDSDDDEDDDDYVE